MLGRLLLIAKKETWHILRDFRTVYLALGIPVVMLLLFGYALTMDVNDIRLIVVDNDRTTASRDLSDGFCRSGYFTVAERPDNTDGLLRAFREGRAKAALIIPRGFERQLARGEKGEAQLITDGTDANTGSIAMGYAAAIAQSRTVTLSAAALAARGLGPAKSLRPPIDVKTRNWFNPTLKSQWYMVPGLIAVILAMMSVLLAALTVAREWERGTMEQLLVTPVHPREIVIGKLIPYYLIGLAQLGLVGAAGVLLFGVPLRGSLLLLVALSSLFLLGTLGQGLLISILTRQQQLAMQFAFISALLPSMLLSGFMSPISSMPKIIQVVSYAIPARYFLVIVRGIFLRGAGMAELWPHALALCGFAAAMVALGVLKFRTRLE